MKHLKGLIFLFAIFMLVIGILFADLYSEYLKPVQQTEATHRYVYLAPNKEEKFWCNIAVGIKEADEESGSNTLLVQYEGNDNVPTYFRDAVLSDVEGIIVKGTDCMNEEIMEAVESGVPVVFYNSDFPDSGRSCYIGVNNYETGAVAAEVLEKEMNGQGKILAIVRSKAAFSQVERIEALEDKIADYPGMEIVDFIEDNGNELELKEKLLRSLKENPDIDAIICMEEVASDSVGMLLKNFEEDYSDLFIVTLDFTDKTVEYIQNGEYDMIVMKDLFQIGYLAVEQLNHYYETKEETGVGQMEEIIDLNNLCLTKDNIEEYVQKYETETLEWNSY